MEQTGDVANEEGMENVASEADGGDEDDDEPEIDRFKCKLCERGKIQSPFFDEVPDLFSHLNDV
jgi:hypothetical protein